jgi:Ca2+-binding EF-hand superfamily protein
MIRIFVRLCLFAVLTFLAINGDALAQCGGCCCDANFKRVGGYSVNNVHSVYLDTGLSPSELAAVYNAVDAWNQALASFSSSGAINYVYNQGAADIIVAEQPSLHGTITGAYSVPGEINLNPDYRNSGDFMKLVLLHEFGHRVGFTDVSGSNCASQTVMYDHIDPSTGSYLTTLTDRDICDVGTEENYELLWADPSTWDQRYSPIIINFDEGGYQLTGANSPVFFDMPGNGHPAFMGWTAAGADEAFLWLDRNHNGRVTSGAELFGNFTPLRNGELAKNGFEALREFDTNNDGVIDNQDSIWPQLMLWRDLNHNGISETGEVVPLQGSGVISIDLHCHWAGRQDHWGNAFKYQSLVSIANRSGHGVRKEPVYDIYFVSVP